MEVGQVKLIYFSPTGTTQKILESIAQGITIENVEHMNLTLPEEAQRSIPPLSDELVIIGAPVYGGRLPVEAVRRLKHIKANQNPAILIVLYGNREFEDALLELKNLAIAQGFRPVAGGAFIGEHSFSTKDLPIASGRPDHLDVQKAMDFGIKIKNKIKFLQLNDTPLELEVPGRFPYEGGVRAMVVSPVTNKETCIVCGVCASVCPTAAISINGGVTTKVESCIRCCACIKKCPTGARVWNDTTMKELATWLNQNCSNRREPKIFGI